MIYLHKILPLLVSPLLLLLTVVIIGLLTSSKKIGLLGVVLLLIFSLPIVADRLVSFLERDYKPLAADGALLRMWHCKYAKRSVSGIFREQHAGRRNSNRR